MVKIKITAGVFFRAHKAVRAGDPAIEVSEAVARRLVEDKRVAEYVESTVIDEEIPAGVVEIIPEYSVEMKANKLREIGAEHGLTFPVGMTKAEMVAELDEHFSTTDEAPTFDAAEAVE